MQIEKIEVGDCVARAWADTPSGAFERLLDNIPPTLQLPPGLASSIEEDRKVIAEESARLIDGEWKPVGVVVEIFWSERGNTEAALILCPDGELETHLVTSLKKVGDR